MADILKQLAALGSLHLNIAKDVYPHGAIMSCCKMCGHTQQATVEDCARYLSRGWPQHCEQPMLVEPHTA